MRQRSTAKPALYDVYCVGGSLVGHEQACNILVVGRAVVLEVGIFDGAIAHDRAALF